MADGRKRIIQFHDIIFLPLIEQALDSHAGPSKQFYFILKVMKSNILHQTYISTPSILLVKGRLEKINKRDSNSLAGFFFNFAFL